ncbi:MAG: hypothetical protein RL215_2397 [Planctomycetota bacterium]
MGVGAGLFCEVGLVKFCEGLAIIEEELGAALGIGESDVAGIDAEVAIECCEDVFPGDGS